MDGTQRDAQRRGRQPKPAKRVEGPAASGKRLEGAAVAAKPHPDAFPDPPVARRTAPASSAVRERAEAPVRTWRTFTDPPPV